MNLKGLGKRRCKRQHHTKQTGRNSTKQRPLKALLAIFQEIKFYSGNWSDIVGQQLTTLDLNKFWLYDGIAYALKDDATLPTLAPSDPTTQPNQYQKTEYAPRQEIEGTYVHNNIDQVIAGTLQLLKADQSTLRISSSDNGGKSTLILDENGSGTPTKGLFIERDNATNTTKIYTKYNGDHQVFQISSYGSVYFTSLPRASGTPSSSTYLTNKGYVDTTVQTAADTAEENAKNASLPLTGGTMSGDINLYPQGKGVNVGSSASDRFKITKYGDNFTITYYDGSYHHVIEQNKANYINFLTQPKHNNENLATEAFVEGKSMTTGAYYDYPEEQNNPELLLCDGRLVKKAPTPHFLTL